MKNFQRQRLLKKCQNFNYKINFFRINFNSLQGKVVDPAVNCEEVKTSVVESELGVVAGLEGDMEIDVVEFVVVDPEAPVVSAAMVDVEVANVVVVIINVAGLENVEDDVVIIVPVVEVVVVIVLVVVDIVVVEDVEGGAVS